MKVFERGIEVRIKNNGILAKNVVWVQSKNGTTYAIFIVKQMQER